MLQSGCSAAALCAAYHCHCQQLPGTFKLLQVLRGPVLQHVRHVAQAARQQDGTLEASETQISQLLRHGQQLPHTAEPRGGNGGSSMPLSTQSHDAMQQRAVPAGVQEATLQMQRQQQQAQHAVVSPATHQPPSPTGVKKTFYKRKLPCPPATEFSSSEGTSQSYDKTHMASCAHRALLHARKH